jgi:hypothetical protein
MLSAQPSHGGMSCATPPSGKSARAVAPNNTLRFIWFSLLFHPGIS